MTRLRGTILAAAVPLLLISACAQTAGNSAAASPDARDSSAAPYPQGLVLRVESFGGFVPPEHNLGRLPAVSIYADGRMISEGPTTAIYPGPALPNLLEQMLTPEMVQDLVKKGQEAGVRNGADFGSPNIADAPSTRVVAGDQSVSVVALSEAQASDPNLTTAQRTARNKLAAYVKTLESLSGAPGVAAPVAYVPDSVAALVRSYVDPQGEEPKSPEIAWPGPTLPGPEMNPGLGIGCVDVTGPATAKVLTSAKTATTSTPWTAGGAKWSITFRPLLPEEKSCAALKGVR
ncbi:hypothetical protein GCM10010172_61630 [Paractinoplanes ferrugineus]|uniref:Uncharacterized protein n=1 Tax=Paractinoplanes ferrugineus TaxID=113564 RepID=A0A919MH33_9ACTN|nr:hypothetical protein [Actinoplanes ferrugineus]GIE14509.1 hypothetical protein Afe05nite_63490 [Actinoplanes ferrugineus]